MSSHEEFEELASLLALGALDVETDVRLATHLASGCELCSMPLRRLVRVADALASVVAPVDPRPEVGSRTKATIRRTAYAGNAELEAPEDHGRWEGLLELATFGALSQAEQNDVYAHVESGCDDCRARLRAAQQLADSLASTTGKIEPSTRTSERIKQLVRERGAGSRDMDTARTAADPGPRMGAGDSVVPSATLIAEHVELLGRDAEIATIEHRLSLLGKGEGSVVTVEGDAGLGKSRLAREAANRARAQGVEVWTGQAVEIERTGSYAPFVELLQTLAGIDEDTDDLQRAELLETALRLHCGDSGDEIFPAIARLMAIDPGPRWRASLAQMDGPALERLVHRSVSDLFARLLTRGPMVLVLDDLHWADESTLALLGALLPLVERHALMLLVLARPEGREQLAAVADTADEQSRLRHDRISLEPLQDRHAMSLARGLLGGDELPEALARVVTTKAEGNPFYVEELIRSIQQAGGVERQRGRLVVTTDLDALPNLQGVAPVIQSRVAQLPEVARLVLETASVIGRRFQAPVLARMLDDPSDLDDVLALLDRTKFIVPARSHATADARVRLLRPEIAYAFRHAFVQETVLDSVPETRRRVLHARCAAAIEELFEQRLQDHYGVLAYQYAGAGLSGQALEYLTRAGEIAAAAAASADALRYFREAYDAYRREAPTAADAHVEARLERNVALALLNTGNLSESVEHFNSALRSYGEWVPRSRLLAIWKAIVDGSVVLARLYTGSLARTHRPADARERTVFELMYNRCRVQNVVDDDRRAFDNLAAIRHVGHLDPSSVENSTGILAAAGAFFAFSGISFGPSRRFLDLAANCMRAGGDRDRFLYKTMAFVVHFLEGDWSREHEIEEPLLEQGLRYGLLWDADVYLGMLCERNIYQAEFDKAAAQSGRFESLRRDWGYEFARSNELATIAYLRFAERRLQDAQDAVQRWYDFRAEPSLHSLALGLRSRIEILRGDCDAASLTLARADRLAAGGGPSFPYYAGMRSTARLALAVARLERSAQTGERVTRSNVRAARRDCRRALHSAMRCARDRGETLRLAGRLQWVLGDRSAAFEYWRRAQAECERLGARAELARVWADLGDALSDEDSARFELKPDDFSARARAAFLELGCTWDLEQLEQIERKRRRAA